MATDLNQCNFIGRLGKDPETKTFPSGDEITNISIAVGKSWKDKQTGEKKDKTEWVNIVFTKGLSDVAKKYLHKGDQVFVSGELTTRKWTDNSGQTHYSTDIRATNLQMLGSKQESQQSQYQQPQQVNSNTPKNYNEAKNGGYNSPTPSINHSGDITDMDDDVPF